MARILVLCFKNKTTLQSNSKHNWVLAVICQKLWHPYIQIYLSGCLWSLFSRFRFTCVPVFDSNFQIQIYLYTCPWSIFPNTDLRKTTCICLSHDPYFQIYLCACLESLEWCEYPDPRQLHYMYSHLILDTETQDSKTVFIHVNWWDPGVGSQWSSRSPKLEDRNIFLLEWSITVVPLIRPIDLLRYHGYCGHIREGGLHWEWPLRGDHRN